MVKRQNLFFHRSGGQSLRSGAGRSLLLAEAPGEGPAFLLPASGASGARWLGGRVTPISASVFMWPCALALSSSYKDMGQMRAHSNRV